MFGGLAFLIGGRMACGVLGDTLMVRVGPGERRPHPLRRRLVVGHALQTGRSGLRLSHAGARCSRAAARPAPARDQSA